MLYIVILILVLAVITTLLFIKINILIEYVRNGENDRIIISIFGPKGIFKYKREIPLIDAEKTGVKYANVKEKGKDEKDIEKDKGYMTFIEIYYKIMGFRESYRKYKHTFDEMKVYLEDRLIIKEFKLDVEIGTGDAYYTGVLSGVVWAIVGVITALLFNSFEVQEKSVGVKSNFVGKKFKIDLYCIFRIKFVHIIVVRLKYFSLMLRKKYKILRALGGGMNG